MLWWRVYDHEGREHILNLEHVADIVFPHAERKVADGEEVGGSGFVEPVALKLASGESLWLERNPNRRELVDDLILDASRVEREAIKETKKNPEKKIRDEARIFWSEFPRNHHDFKKDREPTIQVELVVPRWAKSLQNKLTHRRWVIRRRMTRALRRLRNKD